MAEELKRIPYPNPPRFHDRQRLVALAGVTFVFSALIAASVGFLLAVALDRTNYYQPVNSHVAPPLAPDAFFLRLASLNPAPDSASDRVPTTEHQENAISLARAAFAALGTNVHTTDGGQVIVSLPPSDEHAAEQMPLVVFAGVDAPEQIDSDVDVFTHVVSAKDAAHGLDLGQGVVVPADHLSPFEGRTIAVSQGTSQLGSQKVGVAAAVELVARIVRGAASDAHGIETPSATPVLPTRWPHLFVVVAPDTTLGRGADGVLFDIDHIPPGGRVLSVELLPPGSYADRSCHYNLHTANFTGYFALPSSADAGDRASARMAAFAAGVAFEAAAPLQADLPEGFAGVDRISEPCTDEYCLLRAYSCAATAADAKAFQERFARTVATAAADTSPNLRYSVSTELIFGDMGDSRPSDDLLPALWRAVAGAEPGVVQTDSTAARVAAQGHTAMSVAAGGVNHGSQIEFVPIQHIHDLADNLARLVEKYATNDY